MKISWSVKMADSVVKGHPNLNYDRWAYDNGVVMLGMLKIWRKTGEKKYFNVVADYMDTFVYSNGMIKDYRPYDYNIDLINNGKICIELFKETGSEKFKKAAFKLRNQLYKHPRTKEGALWHKKLYPNQVWLDGLYMGQPFYANFIKEFELKKNYNDVIRQFIACQKNMKDKKTGLYYHAWDENRTEFWCDKKTGLSKNFWGRSIGWLLMAMIDVIEIIPKEQNDKDKLVDMFIELLNSVFKFQDEESGCWYQVIDMGNRKGNYFESSSSCMFLYSAAKAWRMGFISGAEYKKKIDRAYNGIIDEFVLVTESGMPNINKSCMVAGLGGRNKRNGSYSYYISEPIICNDLKAVGAFINAMYEYESYLT